MPRNVKISKLSLKDMLDTIIPFAPIPERSIKLESSKWDWRLTSVHRKNYNEHQAPHK